MDEHRSMLMSMVWVWVQIRRKMLGYAWQVPSALQLPCSVSQSTPTSHAECVSDIIRSTVISLKGQCQSTHTRLLIPISLNIIIILSCGEVQGNSRILIKHHVTHIIRKSRCSSNGFATMIAYTQDIFKIMFTCFTMLLLHQWSGRFLGIITG